MSRIPAAFAEEVVLAPGKRLPVRNELPSPDDNVLYRTLPEQAGRRHGDVVQKGGA